MTTLTWDQVGSRRYETGIDRGVLYTLDGVAVPWNGLVSISENLEREVKSYYLDGVKYLDHQVVGAYAAKLGAYTYPDELDALLGQEEFAPGVVVHDQRAQMFHLSYRTRVGNDVDGIDHGYKIHIVYNILASPSSVDFGTLSNSAAAELFQWDLTGTPAQMFGVHPTSHISLHSRGIDPDTLLMLEELIYGTSETDPSLPGMVDLLALAA
jgi:hypothetical protein